MSAAWDAAREQARGAALLAGAEASWLGEDPVTAADLRALAEALRLREAAADYLLVIRARPTATSSTATPRRTWATRRRTF